MSRSRNYAVRCPECGSVMPFELYDSVTSSLNPELRKQILDGRFETAVCPDCGAVSYIQYDITTLPEGLWYVWGRIIRRCLGSLIVRKDTGRDDMEALPVVRYRS